MVAPLETNPHVPAWVLEKSQSEESQGVLQAATLFVDISGFTPLTTRLMEQGKQGAEALATALRFYFDPPVNAVHQHHGFITGFAGDAFLAVFSAEASEQPACSALLAALAMQSFVEQHSTYTNEYGEFKFGIKVGLSWGAASWSILPLSSERLSCCWRGPSVEGCFDSESHANRGDVVLNPSFLSQLQRELSGATTPRFAVDAWQVGAETQAPRLTLEFFDEGFARCWLPESGDLVLGLADKEQASHVSELDQPWLEKFVPPEILKFPWLGEWRRVVAVFLEFAHVENLNDFGSYLFRKVEEFKGTFTRIDFDDKGNNALLLFGAPTSYEHDLERALACVWSIMEQANPVWRMRAGVAYGHVYAGFNGGMNRHEFACLGRAVPMSVRLMSKAKWGEIWCSEEVQERAPHPHIFRSLGPIELKGFSQPAPSYVYTGQSTLLQGSEGPVVMVGRAKELQRVLAEMDRLVSGKATNLLYIDGDPGVGKSTLVQATRFQLRSRESKPTFLWLHAPCDQTLQKSFYPIATAIRSRFLLTHLLPYEEQLSRFHAHLDGLSESLPSDATISSEDVDRVRSILGALVDLRWDDSLYEKLEPNERLAATHRALAIWLKAESYQAPIVFEVEDGQWADEATKEALQILWKTLRNESILFLLPCRFHDDGKPFRLEPEGRGVVTISLRLLTEDDLIRLAEEYLKSKVSPSLVRLMVERTEGNPFFAEQVLGYLQDHDGLVETPEGLAPKQEGIIVPEDVHNVLMARLDRLSLPIKQTVQAASVLGVSFDPRVLAAMMEHEKDVNSRLAVAQQEQIWSQLKEFLYLFRHALLRDTAYDMQTHARLKHLHKLAAVSIEELYHQELTPHYVALAHHFDQAEGYEKAIEYLELAGNVARENYHNHAAYQSFARALDLLPERGEVTHRVAKVQARTLNVLARWDDALKVCDQAEQALESEHPEVACIRASIYVDQKNLEDAEAWARKAIVLAEEQNDKAHLAHAWNVLGLVAWNYRKMDDSESRFLQALEYYREAEDVRGEAKLLSNLSILAMIRKEYDKVDALCHESLLKARIVHALRVQASCLNNLGNLTLVYKEYEKAQGYYQHSLELRREIGDRRGEAMMLGNLGGLNLANSTPEEALVFLQQAQLIYDELGDKDPHVKFHQVEALRILERYDESLALLNEASAQARDIQNTEYISYSRMLRGHLHRTSGELDLALEAYQEALQMAQDDKLANLEADIQNALEALDKEKPIPLSVV
ncbi:MAG: tetratricopeptide repeat protein [Deltaproteobacteria bacterium]|nr:MAG: tetratricopeptide repeat protein [Deltaproteobacteria bacterium]